MVASNVPEPFSRSAWYCSSTEASKLMAYGRNFGDAELPALFKHMEGRARPVRSIPVSGDDTVT